MRRNNLFRGYIPYCFGIVGQGRSLPPARTVWVDVGFGDRRSDSKGIRNAAEVVMDIGGKGYRFARYSPHKVGMECIDLGARMMSKKDK